MAKRNTPDDFWKKVHKSDDCWLWQGAIVRGGYGQFRIGGRAFSSHRFAWSQVFGPIPDGLDVLHHCDVPRCVNPKHLWTGTHTDNMRDMAAKGRRFVAAGELHWKKRHPEWILKGDAHPQSLLTDAQIAAIRAARQDGIMPKELALRYGVKRQYIYDVLIGKARKLPR